MRRVVMMMMDDVALAMVERFGMPEDPRAGHARRHELLDIIGITLCAVISAADNWGEIEEFGKAKEDWFRRFLRLPNGIPSRDTFGKLFGLLGPERFAACFMDWVRSVRELAPGEVVSIGGKTLRGCLHRANGRGPLGMASAWAHSKGITAIPKLLRVPELKGRL